MRSRTIRLAAAASAARNTVIPFAARAAMVLFTRTSSARVPHRLASDPSGSTSISLIICTLLLGNRYTCAYKYFSVGWLHVQIVPKSDAAARFDRIVARELPSGRGLRAWDALLRAHATLLRQLETDLEEKTGLALADFDVLAQLAIGGGSLRMTELADRALISRSGMTRRVTRLVRERLVRRAHADGDARGVVVQLTKAGLDRLTGAAPVHMRGVSDLFLTKLDDKELAVLDSALAKVTLDCTFG